MRGTWETGSRDQSLAINRQAGMLINRKALAAIAVGERLVRQKGAPAQERSVENGKGSGRDLTAKTQLLQPADRC
jgi:hypothetical protein